MSDIREQIAQLSPEQRKQFLQRLQQEALPAQTQAPQISRRADPAQAPLSFAQQRMWLLDQLEPGNPLYTMTPTMRLSGPLDVAALARGLNAIIQRHEGLRATFPAVDGLPVQLLAPQLTIPLPLIDLRGLAPAERATLAQQLLDAAIAYHFDLATGPLVCACLLRLADDEHILTMTMHHIVSDGWSLGVLIHELVALYVARTTNRPVALAALPIQYADFAAWQRAQLQGAFLETQLAYWRQQLVDVPVLQLPIDYARPAIQTYRSANMLFTLAPALTAGLKALSRRASTTLFMTQFAVFVTLLSRLSGQADFCVGSLAANRTQPELERLIGFFVNNLPLRIDLSGQPSAETLLRRVRAVTLGAYNHQDVPFELVLEALNPTRTASHTPLYQTMCVMQNFPRPHEMLPGLVLHPLYTASRRSGFDLTFWFWEEQDGLVGELEYNPLLFAPATIQRIVGQLRTLLTAVVVEPTCPLSALPLLSAAEQHQLLVEWQAAATSDPADQGLPTLFARSVARTPDAIAIVFDETKDEGRRTKDASSDQPVSVQRSAFSVQSLTYHELHRRANQLAHQLRSLGVGPEVLVGVCMPRALELPLALLAVLAAGGAYVPLDPSYPADRLAFMLADSQVKVLLTTNLQDKETSGHGDKEIAQLPVSLSPGLLVSRTVLDLHTDWPAIAHAPTTPPPGTTHRDQLAYVIYTSGSTGMPKAALNSQRAIRNRLHWMQDAYQLTPADRVLQKTPFSFDVAVWEFFWPLLVGARLVLAQPGGHQDPAYLRALIDAQQITTLHFVPSMLQAFLEQPDLGRCASLTRVICSGEALPPALVTRYFRQLQAPLYNLYGPTEAAVDVTAWTCLPDATPSSVPIGRPITNTQIYLLDAHMRAVPIGVAGELYIGGVQVGRGYLHRPDLTAERFVPNPFVEVSGVGYHPGYRVSGIRFQGSGVSPDTRHPTPETHPDTRYPTPATRLYKTGDLARYRPDGAIDFLGRRDGQVKLRGFRIELDEIATRLRQHAAVRECVVLVREDTPGDQRLVAYVVPAETLNAEGRTINGPEWSSSAFSVQRSALGAELRAFLQQHLPDYMLPAAFVFLDAFPLTPSGKLDRRALPAPATHRSPDEHLVVARTPIEQALTRMWAEVLRLEQVGVEDNFFALGGHSLLATQLIARIQSSFQVELPLRAVFEAPTVAGLALRIASAQHPAQDHTPPSHPLAERVAPLSFAQQRLWFLDQLQPGLANYNVTVAVELRGSLDVAALEWSFNEVVRRHAVLRTTFAMLDEQPAQLIAAALAVPLALVDLREHHAPARSAEIQRRAAVEARHAFDLARGPLLRTSLLHVDEQIHVLLLNVHHIIADGWSMGVLIEELAALYAAAAAGQPAPLPALPMQYADYALQQREWLRGADDPHTPAPVQTQLTYWRRQLADLPTLVLPTDRQRPAVLTNRGARCRFQVPRALSEALTTRSQAEGVTLFMTLLATFQLVLARESGQDDIAVGTPIANRTRRETEGMIGFFVNTLVMRTDLRGDPTLRELLGRVRACSLDAFAHQDLPLEMLVETLQPTRELNRTPLFQVLFVLQNAPLVLDMPGLRLRMLDIESESAKFDMTLSMMETPQGLSGVWEYATDLFEAATIRRMCAYFQALLVGLVADPGQRLAELLGAADAGWRAYMQLDFDLADAPLAADAQALDLRGHHQFVRVAPLSFAQQRLWFLDQFQPDDPSAVIVAVQLTGELRAAALQASFTALIERHEVLRTTFATTQGRPVQLIAPATALRRLPLRLLDLGGLSTTHMPLVQRLASAEARQPFDLSAGPLLRATLLRLGPQEHVLLLALPQIVADDWSISIIMTEIAAHYDAFIRQQPALLPALPVQYADYVLAQRTELHEQVRAAQLDYWRDALAGAPLSLELPFDHPRPPVRRQRGAQQSRVLPSALGAAFAALGQRESCTLFETLLAAFVLLLYRYTGQDDIVVGTPIARRTPPELEQLIGRFSNTLALRTRMRDDLSFAALLERVRLVSRDALAHQELPFELVTEALLAAHDFRRAPLFQALFQLQNAPPAIELPDLALRLMPIMSETTPFDLALALTETESGLLAVCNYSTDLFDAPTIIRLLGQLQTLLHGCAAHPEQRLSDLPLLTSAERVQLLHEWNDSEATYPYDAAVHALFEAQAARTPDAIALVFDFRDKETRRPGDQETRRQADKETPDHTTTGVAPSSFVFRPSSIVHLTYDALNAHANQLAHYLQARGVGPDTLVALCAERSLAMLVGILGILKAGGAYVPLDPAYPAERLAFMLDDCQAKVIVVATTVVETVRRTVSTTVIDLVGDWSMLAGYPTTNPPRRVTSEQRAYVIYTSGSTGRPKGVMVRQRGLLNLVYGLRAFFDDPAVAAVGLITSISFDISVNQIFPTLLFGRTLHIIPDAVKFDSVALLGYAHAHGLHLLDAVPSYMQAVLRDLAPARLPNVFRYLLIGGEPLDPALVQQIFAQLGAQVAVVNIYGLSEISDINAFAVLTATERDAPVTIGQPLQNNQLYILNPRRQLQPIGVVGELCIAGASLSRGYLNRPELTAERFVPDPWGSGFRVQGSGGAEASDTRYPAPDTRMCATGDLARRLPDGRIELLGRIDQQVKIRGFRIEVGEIETLLAMQPSVRECVVVARVDAPGDTRLVAYVVPTNDERRKTNEIVPVETQYIASVHRPSSLVSELRAFLAERLPDYMIPSAFVLLDALPKTPNGKLDRRALPAPDLSGATLDTAYVAPRTPTEELLADIWAQVLRRERVGVHDNFFELGGHSLLATQMLYRVRQAFQVELTLRVLFEAPTVVNLAVQLERSQSIHAGRSVPPIPLAVRSGPQPLSFAQQRLWFLDQLAPGSATYTIPSPVRLTGALDLVALHASFHALVRRHEPLRTSFRVVDGQPTQIIALPAALPLPLLDVRGLPEAERETAAARAVVAEALTPFDLARGPLVRTTLLRLDDQTHIVLVTLHHIIADGWSVGVLIRDLAALYVAATSGQPAPLPALPIQYADYAIWQRQWLQGAVRDAQVAYWRSQLADAPTLDLPLDRPRPPVQTFRGAEHTRGVPALLHAALQTLSQRAGVTLFMTLLAVFQALLARHSGQDDILVGSPIAGRTQQATEGLIGLFVNTLVLRTDLRGDRSFQALLGRVRAVCLGAYAQQDLPFDQLVEALQPVRDLSRHPLFQVMFVLQNAPLGPLDVPGLTLQPVPLDTQTAKFELTLSVVEDAGGLIATWEYNTDLFDATTITRLAGHFHTLLCQCVATPDHPISMLPLLGPNEQHQLLVEWQASATAELADVCLPTLVERQAARTPDAIALVYETKDEGRRTKDELSGFSLQPSVTQRVPGLQLTYQELNRRANQLAHHLRSLGVGPEVRVALCLERSSELVVALLGVLKAGGAYVPLDPMYPPERLAFMLDDSQAPILLTQTALDDGRWTMDDAAQTNTAIVYRLSSIVYLDADWPAIARQPASNPCTTVQPANLAYVIYTSGSTGRPKGVAITHRSAVALLGWAYARFTAAQLQGVLAATSICFDLSVFELFVPLSRGGTIILVENALALPRLHAAARVTLINTVPSVMTELLRLDGIPPSVRTVNLAGEQLPRQLVQQLYAHSGIRAVFNLYGPSEDTTYSTGLLVPADDPDAPPIGHPITNTQAYVLDRQLRPVPIGVAGELYLGGTGLARGYLNRPDLTAERFVPNPFAEVSGTGYHPGYRVSGIRFQGSGVSPDTRHPTPETHPDTRYPTPATRLYKTGDLVRWRADGQLVFLGRRDEQVKLRGFRIELEEIATALGQHPAVQECIVLLREDTPGDAGLVAYVVPDETLNAERRTINGPESSSSAFSVQRSALGADLRAFLSEKLPAYMLPATFVFLDKFPLTPNGKIDRRALPALDHQSDPTTYVAPRDATEALLAQLWGELLGVAQVGVHENFFELGGHSLLAMRLMLRLREGFAIDLPVRTLFEAPTVASLAEHIATLQWLAQSTDERVDVADLAYDHGEI